MKVAIVHYHLRVGGVTRVIENAVAALGDRVEVVVFSGEPAPESGVDLSGAKVVVVPGLNYRGSGTVSDATDLFDRLTGAARRVFGSGGGPDLWHFHNHGLGKNVCLPAVVDRLAEKGGRLLLQVHDFAEDGRPENYRRQRKFSDEAGWYPAAAQIHYAVLNTRDADFLRRAGLGKSQLHVLAGPAVAPPENRPDPGSRPFAAGRRFLLCPTRGIRRKNLGELVLLAAMAGGDCEFATTLTPENPEWRPIHDRWIATARAHGLPVRFGLGEDARYRFESLVAWSDALITTSVAEGFGLVFLEPWLAGKSVAGRNLPEVTGDLVGRGLRLESLYESLPVPLDWIDGERFRQRLGEALAASFRRYGREIPNGAADRAWHAAVSEGNVDFGRLDEPFQEQAIERALREGWDGEAAGFLEPVSPDVIDENAAVVRRHYSLAIYGDRLFSIYEKIADTEPGEPAQLDGDVLLDAFLDPARFCLLRH